ncbi:MAG: HEPN domain-containing protein [Acidimicrobiales bacterium]
MARGGRHHNWRCFLAEQAAQMAMKALLHGLGRGPWGHDLVDLGNRLAGGGRWPPRRRLCGCAAPPVEALHPDPLCRRPARR